jgi:prophage regulatory protein
MRTPAENTFALSPSGSQDRLIRRDELREIVPVSDPTLWRWERDGKFPKRINLARNLVAWRLSDVNSWLAAQGRDFG